MYRVQKQLSIIHFFNNNVISYMGRLISQNGGHFGDKMGVWINRSCCRQKSTLSC